MTARHGREKAKNDARVAEATSQLWVAAAKAATAGGGRTVITNAPNPAGLSVLAKHFQDGDSPLRRLRGALAPTAIVALWFWPANSGAPVGGAVRSSPIASGNAAARGACHDSRKSIESRSQFS
jgi:hypothetical protein